MAPPADMEKRGVNRMVERGRTRRIRRGVRSPNETIERLSRRNDANFLTQSPEDVAVIARQESELPAARAADMRSRVVRRVVEMELLDAERGLARAAEKVQREAAPSSGDKGKGTSTVFEKWVAELKGKKMSEREIEEHLAARVRGVKRGLALMMDERRVGRRG